MKKLLIIFRYSINNFMTIAKYLRTDKYIFVDGYPHTKNFGDALGTPIVEFLSEKKVLPSKNISRFLFQVFKFKNYAVVGGNVTLGRGVHVGTNATIRENINIGDFSIIGSGSVVLKDVPENSIYIGNPAKLLKKK